MIGEIRDLETAQIAVQASLTGHLVLATLHTNDAASAVTRLADMGVEPYLLASSLLGVLAQRLVRTLCPACRARARADGRRGGAARRARPAAPTPACDGAAAATQCHDTGYRGRTGIYELLVVDDALRRLIHDRAPEHALRAAALARGHDAAAPRRRALARRRHDVARRAGPRHARVLTRSAAHARVSLRGGRRARASCGTACSTPRRRARRATGCARDGLFPTAIEPVAATAGQAGAGRSHAAAGGAGRAVDAAARDAGRARACRSTRRWPRSPSRPTTRAPTKLFAAAARRRSSPGESLAGALARWPRTFSDALPRPGRRRRRRPGASPTCWRASPTTSRRAQALRQKFTLALIYPALVTVIALAVIAVLLVYVVPQVVSVYQQSRQTLPWLTRALIARQRVLPRDRLAAGSPARRSSPSRSRVANRRAAFRARWHARAAARCRSSGASSPPRHRALREHARDPRRQRRAAAALARRGARRRLGAAAAPRGRRARRRWCAKASRCARAEGAARVPAGAGPSGRQRRGERAARADARARRRRARARGRAAPRRGSPRCCSRR